eukprot:c15721_g1_i1.p1 GENE.c15721_g1_i1~~c15721_g1_i1.p1  ORF type:complete len:182 (+),score=39.93 c15721_g1_i1:47-547(+)
MWIKIAGTTKEGLELQVTPGTTIGEVKAMLSQSLEGIAFSDQTLVFCGTPLLDEQTLAEADIQDDATLDLKRTDSLSQQVEASPSSPPENEKSTAIRSDDWPFSFTNLSISATDQPLSFSFLSPDSSTNAIPNQISFPDLGNTATDKGFEKKQASSKSHATRPLNP